jgi:hypothetical protein
MSAAPPDLLVRDVIAAEIAKRKARFDRMPAHWEARRIEEMREIEKLVDQWLALGDEQAAASDR